MNKKIKTTHISNLNPLKLHKVNLTKFSEHRSSIDFSNPKKIREILLEHISDGDHETFFDVLALYLNSVGKSKISKQTKIPERTIYNFITKEHKTSSENVFKIMKFLADEEKKAA